MTNNIIASTPVHLDMDYDINVVWLKRDLRLNDHEPLSQSIKSGVTLLYYVFEPLLIDDPHYDERHWRFVWQSIQDINIELAQFNTRVYVYFGDVIDGLNVINSSFNIIRSYIELPNLFHLVWLTLNMLIYFQSIIPERRIFVFWELPS